MTSDAPQFANSAQSLARGGEARRDVARLPESLEEEIRQIYARSPLYAERFPLHPEPLHWACYREIPALSKEEVVAHGVEAFFQNYAEVERGLQEARYEYESTGGTTQSPMTVIMEKGWWEAQTERAYRASPILCEFVGRHYRKCVLAPVGCSSNLCPYEDHAFPNRYFDGTVYLNLSSDPFSFPEREWDRIVLELQATKPEVLEGEPVYLSLLARALTRRAVRVPSVRVVILTYGKASRQHAARVSEVFPGARLVDLYGSTEAGYLFVGEAFCDNAQPVEANAFIELAEPQALFSSDALTSENRATSTPNGVYELIVTTRGREAMPLLRYRTGDLVRKLPTGYRLLGRARELYQRPYDGTLISVYEVDAALPPDFACWHYQLIQTSAARWDFYYVADATYPAAKLEMALSALLGAESSPVRVNAFRRRVIAPTASGKFRGVSPLRWHAATPFDVADTM